MPTSQWAVYAGFSGSKPGFHPESFRDETKEKGAINKAHFPR